MRWSEMSQSILTLLCMLFLTNQTTPSSHFGGIDSGIRCRCAPRELCPDYHDPDTIEGSREEPDSSLFSGLVGIIEPRMTEEKCEDNKVLCCEFQLLGEISNSVEVSVEDTTHAEEGRFRISTEEECGRQTIVSSRITTLSRTTVFSELPWNIIIFETNPLAISSYLCGGSLIHSQVVLTASHCVYQYRHIASRIMLRAGDWDIAITDEPIPHQDRIAKEIIVHSHYDARTLKNDIALVILNEPFVLKDNVRPICLPDEVRGMNSVDLEKCIVSGWGKSSKQGSYSSVLKKVEVPLIPRKECVKKLWETALGKRFLLHRSFICAGGEMNKDACKGDGGSPLICLNTEIQRYVQVGIVSWGLSCGQEVPGIYVHVRLYWEWIKLTLWDRGIEINLGNFNIR